MKTILSTGNSYMDKILARGIPVKDMFVVTSGVKHTPHVHQEAIIAWANGFPIQYLSKKRNYWVCTTSPSWRLDTCYRVKPPETSV